MKTRTSDSLQEGTVVEKTVMCRDKKNISIMIAASASNSGKTAVSCGLMALMRNMGFSTCGFKCGPDYIDPMFHRSVLGIESHNLDIFLAGEEGAAEIYREYSAGKEAVICEGVMGYYDGIKNGDDLFYASPWHLASILDIPVILVVRPKGAALSIAALIKGFAGFRSPSKIAGVILNDCSPSYFQRYGKMLEEESGIPVLGYLPHMEEAVFESRHLGLMTAAEIVDLRERIDRLAAALEETVDIERLMKVGESPGSVDDKHEQFPKEKPDVRIAVARDEAFCFAYEETLDGLRKAGAEIAFFSPIHDDRLPDGVKGIYLPGGYPELYAGELSKNREMIGHIKDAVTAGIPTIAECGGFLYLGASMEDSEGRRWEMADVFPGTSRNSGRLVRFGYGYVVADENSMLFRKGEKIPAHEFHYWDTTANGTDLELRKVSDDSRWRFGYCSETLYAGFPHLYMAGEPDLASRFVEAARACEI